MVKILADSTCDLSAELVEKYNIDIIPLHILLGEKEYCDGVDITPTQIIKWSDDNDTTPKTSAISIDETAKVFEKYVNEGMEIVAFAISSSMSTTYNVMKLAAQDIDSEDKVSVIDSANLSTGIGLLVIEAAIMARQGATMSDITNEMNRLIPLVRASFVVDTLTYLHRGGRCGSVAAMAGSMLKLHPKIAVENGKMEAGKKYRGRIKQVVMEYVKELEPQLICARPARVFITYSPTDEEIVNQVREYLESLHYFEEILQTEAGGVVTSHCGPGTLGVLYIAEE
ncbi:MAG: DegV family protein [Lachnospiraceae bacterium]|nr:DegV family protein [Candidatus Colinaster equi]